MSTLENHKHFKKHIFLWTVLLVLILISLVCYLKINTPQRKTISFAYPHVLYSEKNLSKEAQDAITRYLDGFKYPNKYADDAIENYSIQTISGASVSDGKLHFKVVYSVKIAQDDGNSDSYWAKGNVVLKDGWIMNKSATAKAVFLDGHYIVEDLESEMY